MCSKIDIVANFYDFTSYSLMLLPSLARWRYLFAIKSCLGTPTSL